MGAIHCRKKTWRQPIHKIRRGSRELISRCRRLSGWILQRTGGRKTECLGRWLGV